MVVLHVMHKINSQYIHKYIHKCNHKECRYGGAAGYAGNCGVHCDTDAGGLAEKQQIGKFNQNMIQLNFEVDDRKRGRRGT